MSEWITANWDNVLAWIGAIVSCASIIVKLTPTTKDDTILNKIVNVLEKFSVFNTAENQKKINKKTKK